MQTWSGPNTNGTGSASSKIVVYTLLFFSLAGLIAGFAFGGFLHSTTPTTSNSLTPTAKDTPIARATSHVTPTPTAEAIVPLGIPAFQQYPTAAESANGTEYSVGIQAVDKQNKPVSASDITCKAWLVQQIPNNQILQLDPNTLKTVSNLTNPLTGTINNQPAQEIGGLTFDQTTPQVGFCNPNGQMTWKYKIAPSLPAGAYDIVVLVDWKGIHYNWSWATLNVVAQ